MAFKALLMAHAPDADPETHRSAIDTGMYQLYTVVVKNQAEAIAVCREFVEEKGIDSVLLCPGFTHRDVAGIAQAVGENVGVSVARGDGPSNRISQAALKRAGFIAGAQAPAGPPYSRSRCPSGDLAAVVGGDW
jgi:stage V sporulation protein SpoVS